ncbi:MAG: hypothetical protein Q7T11_05320 [Deltaproteobacteria bacterium]|nr:hypothetical protein [Deltaproteobacteria bacterium]
MLKRTPTNDDLNRLYHELSLAGASAVGEKKKWPYRPRSLEELFCLACEMSRYDPRLITILARFLAEKALEMNPVAIRKFFPAMQSPQTVAVIADFVKLAQCGEETDLLLDYLQKNLEPVPLQYYFHHLYRPGGNLAEKAAAMPLSEYKKWGFLACEAPVFDEKTRQPVGTLDRSARQNVLLRLLQNREKISMTDYLNACGGCVSRQQALLDLKSHPFLQPSGHGRGAEWRKVA